MKNKTTVLLWCLLPPGGETLGVMTLNKVTDLPCQVYFDQDKALQHKAEHLMNYIQQPFTK